MSLIAKDFVDLIALMNPKYNETRTELIAKDLIDSYSAFYRPYHSLNHVESGLNLLKDVKDLCENNLLVVYAWWYHDYLYTPGSSLNELASAEHARFNALLLGLGADVAKNVVHLIIATRHDMLYPTAVGKMFCTDSNDQKIIHDVDLAILGADSKTYDEYANDTEIEYSVFSSDVYNKGRLLILKTFLELEHIFYLKYFQERFEDTARKNLAAEINAIEKAISLE